MSSSTPLTEAPPAPIRSLSTAGAELELGTPPLEQETQVDLMSIGQLADSLDGTSSVPDFLNDLLASSSSSSRPLANGRPTNGPNGTAALPDLATLDGTLNALLTRLNLLSQDTSSELEQSIHDISRTVPRLSYDLQFMRESASTLQLSLSTIQSRVALSSASSAAGAGAGAESSDAAKTQKSLSHLTHLDTLKRRMESARDVLREAESWSTLEGEITGFVSAGEWEKAGSRLSEASKSLVVFQATPTEYESRKALLVSLQNELETALSAALQAALEKSETEEIAKFASIFGQMDREDEFRKYYFGAKRKSVLDEWGNWDGEGFVAFLARWYGALLKTIEGERVQIPKVFLTEAPEVLGEFIRTTLESLSPSIQTRLGSLADSLGATALPELIKAYRATDELAHAIHGVLDKLAAASPAQSTVPLPAPTTPTTPKALLTPLRPSLTRRSTKDESQPQKWEITLYEPFLELQSAYPTLEKRYLQYLLTHDSILSARRDASGLSDRTAAALSLAAEAMGRCAAFTSGYGSKGLVDALGEFLASFFDSQATVTSATPANVELPKDDELDFGEGIDYTTEDWAAFQAALKVLTTCRDVGGKLRSFEERVYTYLETSLTSPTNARPAGATALLAQSPLNSADLHSLLSSLAPPVYPLAPARGALANLTRKSQISLQNIILSPLRALLSGYPSLPVWTQTEKPRKDGLSIPTFSLSPTDTMSRISEGLLNLLRVFEVHADDDALAYSLETLPHLDAEHLAALHPPLATASHLSRTTHAGLSPTKPPASLPGVSSAGGGEQPLEPEMVIATWVSSLSLTLLSDLTRKTLPGLRSLSGDGTNQLAADLAYLGNAVRALDVEWEELELWRGAAEMEEGEWRRKVREEKGVAGEVLVRMGRLRGWERDGYRG